MRSFGRRTELRERRRFVVAYLLSIAAHLIVGAFFVVRALLAPIGGSAGAPSDETLAVTRDAATRPPALESAPAPTTPPVVTPRPLRPSAAPIVRPTAAPTAVPPVVRRAPVPTHPRPLPAVPRRPELSNITPDGTPEPQRLSLADPLVTAAPTEPPSPIATASVAPSTPPTAVPTAPPSAAPTRAPTADPTVVPTRVPTIAPTHVPTIAPTHVPTIAPTHVPTVAPTHAPTVAPTHAPTVSPTTVATVAPTRAATTAPTSAATSAPTAQATAKATAGPTTAAISATRDKAAAFPAMAGTATSAAAARGVGPSGTAGARSSAGPAARNPDRVAPVAAPAPVLASAPRSGPTPGPQAANGGLDKLNSRLNGMLPGGDVAYAHKEFVNDLGAAVDQAKEEYYKAAAPPPSVLAKAIGIIRQGGSLLGQPTILYLLKRQRILGIEICTGWKIEQTPHGPEGGYTFGACGGEEFTPKGGLPTLPPHASG